jgi:hypothetical protein
MDECANYLSGSMDAWMGDVDRRMQRRTRGRSVNECKNVSINGWLDAQMNGSIHRWIDRWVFR